MPLLTIEDMKERFQVDSRTLYNWRKNFGLPFIKIGNVIYFREEAVTEWLIQKETIEKKAQ